MARSIIRLLVILFHFGSCYELDWSRSMDSRINTLIEHHRMNKRVCRALAASTESISQDLENFVLELGFEVPIDSEEAYRKRKCLMMEAKSNAATFVAAIALQKSIQARCRQILMIKDLDELSKDLVEKILERSLVLENIFINEYETFRRKVGYLRQIQVNSEISNNVIWSISDMTLLLDSVHDDNKKIRSALDEISSMRRRLKFKYSKVIALGLFRDEDEKGNILLDLAVIDTHLRFLGKLLDTVLSRCSFVVYWKSDVSKEDEAELRKKAIGYQNAILQLRSDLNDMKVLMNKAVAGLGISEILTSSHRLEKIFIMHTVQIKQLAYLRLTIKEVITFYKRTLSMAHCPYEQARVLEGRCRVVRYMFTSLSESAVWLRRRIKSDRKLLSPEDRKELRLMGDAQMDILRTLQRWERTVDRLDRVSKSLLQIKLQSRSLTR